MIEAVKTHEQERSAPRLTNAWYDRLRFLVQVIIPGFATFYFVMAGIWEWSNAEQVVGTSAAVATFLGLFLRFSDWSYKPQLDVDGEIVITEPEPGRKVISLELEGDPANIENMESVSFRVIPPK